jgi:hypothetical protein
MPPCKVWNVFAQYRDDRRCRNCRCLADRSLQFQSGGSHLDKNKIWHFTGQQKWVAMQKGCFEMLSWKYRRGETETERLLKSKLSTYTWRDSNARIRKRMFCSRKYLHGHGCNYLPHFWFTVESRSQNREPLLHHWRHSGLAYFPTVLHISLPVNVSQKIRFLGNFNCIL